MTSNEFNEKYKDHLEEGFEGLVFLNALKDSTVIETSIRFE